MQTQIEIECTELFTNLPNHKLRENPQGEVDISWN